MIEAFEYFFNSEKLATFLTTLKICWMNCWMQYLKTNSIILFLYDSLVEHSNCQNIVVFDRCFFFYILPPCSKPAVNQESNVRDLKKTPPSALNTHTHTHTHTNTHRLKLELIINGCEMNLWIIWVWHKNRHSPHL